jgi:hypothetical protein
VTLDGQPVEGATVTFMTDDGKQSAAGSTDAAGKFSLSTNGKDGAPPGTYKVVVVKSKKMVEGESVAPDSDAYMKMMKKHANEQTKSAAPKVGGGSDIRAKMMAGMKTGVSGVSPPIQTELPQKYSSPTTTTISVKVPPDAQPVEIALKSK